VLLVSLVTLAVAYPFIESMDHWDAPDPASDTELALINLLAFVCLFFLLAQLLVELAVSTSVHIFLNSHVCTPPESRISVLFRELTPSPPFALRI